MGHIMKKIRKAVFPVAGMGTRFLPATKTSPKEMMPVVDKPLIQYAVEEAGIAGIKEFIFVTSSSKRSIEDHFDSHFELEKKLEAQGKDELLKIVRGVLPEGGACIYIRQPEALGLGHAIFCARNVIGDEPFAVLLADDLIDNEGGAASLRQMVERFEQVQTSIIGVEEIPLEQSDKYGIVGITQPFDRFGAIHQIVEKPSLQDAPSSFAVAGRYILTPAIFRHLEQAKPGMQGELQLTDAIAMLLQDESIYAFELIGKRYDCGSKLGYLKAIVNYGCKHPEVGKEFRDYLNSFAQSY